MKLLFLLWVAAQFGLMAGSAAVPSELPLSLEPNLGQWESSIRFLGRSRGLQIVFTDQGPSLRTSLGRIEMEMLGTQRSSPEGQGPGNGISNYLPGCPRSPSRRLR